MSGLAPCPICDRTGTIESGTYSQYIKDTNDRLMRVQIQCEGPGEIKSHLIRVVEDSLAVAIDTWNTLPRRVRK